jgi:hypothetical protein
VPDPRLDLEAYSGLREVQFFGGFAKAELLRNGTEDHETEVFEARHWMIRTPLVVADVRGVERAGQIRRRLREAAFRKLESDALASDLARQETIVALSGAAIDPIVNQLLLSNDNGSLAVFLDAPFTPLIERCIVQARYRPLLHPVDLSPCPLLDSAIAVPRPRCFRCRRC